MCWTAVAPGGHVAVLSGVRGPDGVRPLWLALPMAPAVVVPAADAAGAPQVGCRGGLGWEACAAGPSCCADAAAPGAAAKLLPQQMLAAATAAASLPGTCCSDGPSGAWTVLPGRCQLQVLLAGRGEGLEVGWHGGLDSQAVAMGSRCLQVCWEMGMLLAQQLVDAACSSLGWPAWLPPLPVPSCWRVWAGRADELDW